MKAYKFYSSSSLEYALDIVLNQRLYCARWDSLNDPMEGLFSYSRSPYDNSNHDNFLSKIKNRKREYRVCSMSEDYDNYLLWSHYADGYDGVAVEVKIPQSDYEEIDYKPGYAVIDQAHSTDPDRSAREILTSKHEDWDYEDEVRVLSTEKWYHLEEPVERIIAGHSLHQALFETLKIICRSQDIVLNRTGIGDTGVDADPVNL
jgi:hypothetical protein